MPLAELALLLVAAGEPAPGFELEWDAPEDCPSVEVVRDRVSVLLGERNVETAAVSVGAQIRRDADEWVLELRAQTESGTTQRTLRADRCEVLAETAAVVIAVAIDPLSALDGLAGEPDEPDPEPAPEPEPEPRPTVAVEPEPDTSPKPPMRVRGHALVGASVRFGPLPGIGPGLSVAVGLGRRLWRVELDGAYETPRTVTQKGAGAGGVFSMWAFGARACASPRLGPVALPVCGGAEAGAMHGRGVGVSRPGSSAEPWVGATFGAGLVWPFHRHVGLRFAGELVVALVRPGFAFDDRGLVHRAPVLSGRVGGGIELYFP